MLLASLPMYDLPELRWATDALWGGLAQAFREQGLAEVPDALSRGGPPDGVWRSPNLLFSQTCGYPLTHGLGESVKVVATPSYNARGCEGSAYCSLIVVRRDCPAADVSGLSGKRAAINGWDSHSGMNAFRAAVAPFAREGRFFGDVLVTGGHRESLQAVARGDAEVAAVDAVTHALLTAQAPDELEGLRVLAETARAPGLPFITAGSAEPGRLAALRAGLAAVLQDPELKPARAALLLTGFEARPVEDYALFPAWAREAAEAGYPELA
jgi:ABC-type phosphate/phosphonate transport system substrate-binding protein